MKREDELFEACRILFGADVMLSRDFLAYLRQEGITSAFRKKAMEIHPDKALISGFSRNECQQEFVLLQSARKILSEYIISREIAPQASPQIESVERNGSLSPITLPERKLPLGRFLYHMGIIQWRQLIQALAWQKSGRPKIGELGVLQGYLERNSVGIILKSCGVNGSFGLTARKLGLLTGEGVRELLLRQKRQQKKIGQFFVEKGVLSGVDLDLLIEQLRKHNRNADITGKVE